MKLPTVFQEVQRVVDVTFGLPVAYSSIRSRFGRSSLFCPLPERAFWVTGALALMRGFGWCLEQICFRRHYIFVRQQGFLFLPSTHSVTCRENSKSG